MANRRSQAGFTMVEVLVSLMLATIAMVGVLALYRSQTTASSFSRRNTEATILAEDQLEHVRAQGLGGTATAVVDERGVVVAGGVFTRTYTVTNSGSSFYDDVEVTVTWQEEGNPKTVRLRGKRNRK